MTTALVPERTVGAFACARVFTDVASEWPEYLRSNSAKLMCGRTMCSTDIVPADW